MGKKFVRYKANELLRRSIAEAGYQITEAAVATGINRTTISSWINGYTRFNPSASARHRGFLTTIAQKLKLADEDCQKILLASESDEELSADIESNPVITSIDAETMAAIFIATIENESLDDSLRLAAKTGLLSLIHDLSN